MKFSPFPVTSFFLVPNFGLAHRYKIGAGLPETNYNIFHLDGVRKGMKRVMIVSKVSWPKVESWTPQPIV
jgi:hypothetical protein